MLYFRGLLTNYHKFLIKQFVGCAWLGHVCVLGKGFALKVTTVEVSFLVSSQFWEISEGNFVCAQ